MSFLKLFFVKNAAAAAGGSNSPDGNGTPGSPAGGAPPATPPAPSNEPWYGKFASSENKGFAEQKNFKDPEALVESYRGLEKLVGGPKEKMIRLPDKSDAPEWQDIFNRMGRPEKPEGYQVPIPEGGDPEFAKWAQGLFHDLGLTKAQGEKLAAKWNEQAAGAQSLLKSKAETDVATQVAGLKKEWGAAYEEKVSRNEELLKAAGIDEPTYDKLRTAMGFDGAEKFLDGLITKFGIQTGEAGFKGGDGSGNNFGGQKLSPAAAKSKLDSHLADQEFVKRYTSGDVEAKQIVGQLHEFMAAGD